MNGIRWCPFPNHSTLAVIWWRNCGAYRRAIKTYWIASYAAGQE